MAETVAERLERERAEHEAYIGLRGPLWCVRLDEPADRLFGETADAVSLAACLMSMHRCARWLPTDEPGLLCVVPGAPWVLGRHDAPLEHIIVPEPSMRGVMACVRRTGLTGIYYRSPEVDRERILDPKGAIGAVREYRFGPNDRKGREWAT